MKINDENLIDQLRNRNEKALDYLIDRYGNLLLKVSYSVLKDREASLECMNDSIFKIWNNIEAFSGEKSKFINWIVVITKRAAIDELRKRDKKVITALEELMVGEEQDFHKQLENKEIIDRLLKEINKMEEVSKEIFLRRFFMDEAIKDIAEKLEISVSAVSNRILRGRKKLEVLFREEVI